MKKDVDGVAKGYVWYDDCTAKIEGKEWRIGCMQPTANIAEISWRNKERLGN